MMTHAAVNAAQHVMYATWRKMMSEPQLDDDIALGKDDDCIDCNEHMSQCACDILDDRMYGDQD